MKKYFSLIFLMFSLTLLFIGCGAKTEQTEIEYSSEEIEILKEGYTLIFEHPVIGMRTYSKTIDGVVSDDKIDVFFYNEEVNLRRSPHCLSDEEIEQLREKYKDYKIPKNKREDFEYLYRNESWRLVELKQRLKWHPAVHYFYKETYCEDVLTGEVYEDEHAGEIK